MAVCYKFCDVEKKLLPERQIRVKYLWCYIKNAQQKRQIIVCFGNVLVCHGLQRRSPIVHPLKKRKQLLVCSLWNSVGFRVSKIPN